MTPDDNFLKALRDRNIAAFKALVMEYAEELTTFACSILDNGNEANEIVDRLLLHLYYDGFANMTIPLPRYLYEELEKRCTVLIEQNRILKTLLLMQRFPE